MKYPCAIVLLPYLAGLLLGWATDGPGWVPLSGLFAVALLTAGAAIGWPRRRPVLLPALLVLTGWTNLAWRLTPLAPDDLRRQVGERAELATVRGTLLESPTYRVAERTPSSRPRPTSANGAGEDEVRYRSVVLLEAQAVQISNRWRSASGRVLATAPFRLGDYYCRGARVEIAGTLQPPPTALAEGLFDYRAYLYGLGVHYQCRTDAPADWRRIAAPVGGTPWADRFFQWAQRTLARGLPAEDEPLRLLWALTLGWKTALTPEVSEPFMRTGTMHIFAVSGLHIALIAGVGVSLLRVARVPRFYCGLLVIPAIWFYTGVSGWQSSAIRSTLMMTVVVGGWSLERPGNLVNSLAAAGFLLLLYDPCQLFQASFQLSFLVVLSMALLMPPLQAGRDRWLRGDPLLPPELRPAWRRWADAPLRWLSGSLIVSLSAWLGSLPLIAHYFHLFTPVSFLANLVLVPLSSWALACNVGSLACGAWAPEIAELFNHSAWGAMWLMVRVNDGLAALPGGFWFSPGPTAADFVAYYAILFGLWAGGWWRCRCGRRWLGGCAAFYVASLGWRLHAAWTTSRIDVLAVAGGDSVVVSHAFQTTLIDGGNERQARLLTRPFLAARGVNHLTWQVVTHGDVRHCGGAAELAAEFQTRHLGVPPVAFRSPPYRRLLADWTRRPGRLRQFAPGEEFGPWQALYPPAERLAGLADDSTLVLLGRLRGTTVLLCSDLTPEGQRNLLAHHPDLRADVVVSGIPSRGEPLLDELLDRVQPRLLIVSAAHAPSMERANPAFRDRLARRGIPVVYTCDAGTVTVELRQGRWTARTWDGRRLIAL